MTVQELIDVLQKIEDKSIRVMTNYRDSDDDVLRVEVFNGIAEIVPCGMYETANDKRVSLEKDIRRFESAIAINARAEAMCRVAKRTLTQH